MHITENSFRITVINIKFKLCYVIFLEQREYITNFLNLTKIHVNLIHSLLSIELTVFFNLSVLA